MAYFGNAISDPEEKVHMCFSVELALQHGHYLKLDLLEIDLYQESGLLINIHLVAVDIFQYDNYMNCSQIMWHSASWTHFQFQFDLCLTRKVSLISQKFSGVLVVVYVIQQYVLMFAFWPQFLLVLVDVAVVVGILVAISLVFIASIILLEELA